MYALKNVNISIRPGALTILRGRSGSGKTTLINLLGVLDYPTSGDIFLMDQKISDLSENKWDEIRRTGMGFVFQSVALIGLMSAYENVEFALRIAGMTGRSVRMAEECLDFVGWPIE